MSQSANIRIVIPSALEAEVTAALNRIGGDLLDLHKSSSAGTARLQEAE